VILAVKLIGGIPFLYYSPLVAILLAPLLLLPLRFPQPNQ